MTTIQSQRAVILGPVFRAQRNEAHRAIWSRCPWGAQCRPGLHHFSCPHEHGAFDDIRARRDNLSADARATEHGGWGRAASRRNSIARHQE